MIKQTSTDTNEVKLILSQGVLPFNLVPDQKTTGLTALAGLPLYLELSQVLGVSDSFDRHVGICRDKKQGFTDRQIGTSLIMLQLAGGDCVDDMARLQADEGFSRVLRRVQWSHLSRTERRKRERRCRKSPNAAVPSPSVVRRYLNEFCHEDEKNRGYGSAFIPSKSAALQGLSRVNKDLVAEIQRRSPQDVATLDMDATLSEVSKQSALYCYAGFRAFAPVNVYWEEQKTILHTEFRDGNVTPNAELQRLLEESLEFLPEGVKKVRFRSDSAGYIVDLLRYMAEGKHPKYGVIDFAVSVDLSKALKTCVLETPEREWKPLLDWNETKKCWQETGQEWADIVFVPNWVGMSLEGPYYRFIAVRDPIGQQLLPGMEDQEDCSKGLHFEKKGRYRTHVIVTNRTESGDVTVRWYRGRCGESEQTHGVLKHELAGASLPSKYFGANAAWWHLTVIAFNLNQAMKRLVLSKAEPKSANRRLKAIRFFLISIPGRVAEHARTLSLRLTGDVAERLARIRAYIARLARAPAPA